MGFTIEYDLEKKEEAVARYLKMPKDREVGE